MVEFDTVIIGAGAAGLTSGLYMARAGMKVVLLENTEIGGQMLLTELIENFPGFPEGIKGRQLAERLKTQAVKWGLEIVREEARQINRVKSSGSFSHYTVETENRSYTAYSVILACGASPKRLGVPGEDKFVGRGVSYCAICDGPLFRNQKIVVVGGGNTACEEALYLSRFASQIIIVHRRDRLRADRVYQDRLRANPKIDFIWNSEVLEILGGERVSGVKIEDVNTEEKSEVSARGVFIFVGFRPNTDFLKGLIKMDSQGFIITDADLQTSSAGIFACGDCRLRPLPQVVTACSEGAHAALASQKYVEKLKGVSYD